MQIELSWFKTQRRVIDLVFSLFKGLYIATFDLSRTKMGDELDMDLVRSCVNVENESKVLKFAEEGSLKATVNTICFIYNSIWTEDEKKIAERDILERNTDSKYYKLLFKKPFNMEMHYDQTDSHKGFVKKAYNRLKEFVPNMTDEDVERHDRTKYHLTQAVGYTARWVHNIDNDTWKEALKDHYKYESHHPQYHDPEKMSKATLEESLIDMVASRWERNLGGKEEATNFELVDFNPVYLSRYQKDDKEEVEQLIKTIQGK